MQLQLRLVLRGKYNIVILIGNTTETRYFRELFAISQTSVWVRKIPNLLLKVNSRNYFTKISEKSAAVSSHLFFRAALTESFDNPLHQLPEVLPQYRLRTVFRKPEFSTGLQFSDTFPFRAFRRFWCRNKLKNKVSNHLRRCTRKSISEPQPSLRKKHPNRFPDLAILLVYPERQHTRVLSNRRLRNLFSTKVPARF